MDIPYYRKAQPEDTVDGMLFLPLEMEKVNDTEVRIYQPDSGYQGYITTQSYNYDNGDTFNEMEHLYFKENDGRTVDYQASEMNLIKAGKGGKKALMLCSYLGDKWCAKSVYWKLEYLDNEWKITEVTQTDQIRIDLNTEFGCDLNGDKAADTVFYGTEVIQENGYNYEEPLLKINGIEYNYKYLEEKFEVFIMSCSHTGYYIMDIDTSDSYREIAILDEGPSDDPVTHFFRFDGKELLYCGSVTDFPERSTFHAYGDGSITASKRLGILQTWWAEATWKLNEDCILEEQISDFYYPYQTITDECTTNYAMNDLTLFKEPDKNSASVTIKKGERIQLTATDNLNWVQITSENAAVGWFYMNDYYDVTLPTGEAKIGDIVQYLNMAD
jgi:hypothetical protein